MRRVGVSIGRSFRIPHRSVQGSQSFATPVHIRALSTHAAVMSEEPTEASILWNYLCCVWIISLGSIQFLCQILCGSDVS
jgi:hypothetical protein